MFFGGQYLVNNLWKIDVFSNFTNGIFYTMKCLKTKFSGDFRSDVSKLAR